MGTMISNNREGTLIQFYIYTFVYIRHENNHPHTKNQW